MYSLCDRLQGYAFLGKKLQLLFIAEAFPAGFYLTFKSFFDCFLFNVVECYLKFVRILYDGW